MQVQVDIEFDQLVQIAKQLSPLEWTKLKTLVDAPEPPKIDREELLSFLLSGPTFSKKQLAEITRTRKAINQWRKK